MKLSVGYSTFEVQNVLIETSLSDVIIAMNYDKNSGKFLIFLICCGDENCEDKWKIKIFDPVKN